MLVATFVLCGNAPTRCKVPQADFAFGCGAIEPASNKSLFVRLVSSFIRRGTKLAGEVSPSLILTCVSAGLLLSLASASAQEVTKLSELVSGMPKGGSVSACGSAPGSAFLRYGCGRCERSLLPSHVD
jgi:hypothetical protein